MGTGGRGTGSVGPGPGLGIGEGSLTVPDNTVRQPASSRRTSPCPGTNFFRTALVLCVSEVIETTPSPLNTSQMTQRSNHCVGRQRYSRHAQPLPLSVSYPSPSFLHGNRDPTMGRNDNRLYPEPIPRRPPQGSSISRVSLPTSPTASRLDWPRSSRCRGRRPVVRNRGERVPDPWLKGYIHRDKETRADCSRRERL